MTITSSFGQEKTRSKHEMFLKASAGTSWIILPKVFLISPEDSVSNAQVLPATNGLTGNLGWQTVFHLGEGWLFVPELNLSYISGEVRINRTIYEDNRVDLDTAYTDQNLQSYVRAEIPLHFGVRSNNNFWVTLGPTLYFTLYDNQGFEEAVENNRVRDNVQLDDDNPFGVRFRLAAYAPVGKRSYIDIRFESDLGQYFRFEGNTYEAKFSFQNISIGYGYRFNDK